MAYSTILCFGKKLCQVHLIVQSQQWKQQEKNVWNLFKVNTKDTRTTSRSSFYFHYWLWSSKCWRGSCYRYFEVAVRFYLRPQNTSANSIDQLDGQESVVSAESHNVTPFDSGTQVKLTIKYLFTPGQWCVPFFCSFLKIKEIKYLTTWQ